MSADWKQIVGAVAPGLATVLGGPVAGMAVAALSKQLLGRSNGTTDEVAAAITAGGGEVLERIKAAEQAFELKARELNIDVERIHAADRDSARKREASTGDTLTPRSLAYLVTAGFFGVLGWLLYAGKPAEGGDALLVMLGALAGAWASVIAYYFGSSAGSAAKTQLLDRKGAP